MNDLSPFNYHFMDLKWPNKVHFTIQKRSIYVHKTTQKLGLKTKFRGASYDAFGCHYEIGTANAARSTGHMEADSLPSRLRKRHWTE